MHDTHALGDRTHRELLLRGRAELADDGDVERQAEDPGDLGGDHDAAAGDAEHDRVGAAPRGERVGEIAPRGRAIGEDGHAPTVRRAPASRECPPRPASFYPDAWKGPAHERTGRDRTRSRHLRRRHPRRIGRPPQRRADDPQRRRPGGARRRGGTVVLRGGGAPSPRVRRLEPRDRARRRRCADRQHPSGHRGDGPLQRRSGARVRAVRDARRDLGRSRRGDPRTRLVHRVLPAVRLRPPRLRGAVRGEARAVLATPRREARHLAGDDPRRARRGGRLPQDRERPRARGSASAARPSPSCGRHGTATGSCSRSSAVPRTGSGPSSICTTGRSQSFERDRLPGGGPLARPRRRHRPAGLGRGVRGLRGDEQHHRTRARLAAVQPHALPARRRARGRPLRRLARDRRPQDRRHRPARSASSGST